ncbi:hypothetical protein [Crossiella sp. CA198]|uniref:hypothetical protein n=1 Tax=Crossiella sp. CA198 TaxID=3455607 RepID=UPI003F8D32A5
MNPAHPRPGDTPAHGNPQPTENTALAPIPARTGMPDRQRPVLARAGTWVGWHAAELTAVSLPLAAAAIWSRWFAVLAAVAGAAWIHYEIRTARQHRTTGGAAAVSAAAHDEKGPRS